MPETNKKVKVLLQISGGCLQSVYADNPNVEVTLLDYDNLEVTQSQEQMRALDDEESKKHPFPITNWETHEQR